MALSHLLGVSAHTQPIANPGFSVWEGSWTVLYFLGGGGGGGGGG